MRLTHYGHACVLIDSGSTRILIDPGSYAQGFEEVRPDAILITHRHFDHFHIPSCATLLERNPSAQLWIEPDAPIGDSLPSHRIARVSPGEHMKIGDVDVEVVGGVHARVHPDLDTIPNVGYFFPSWGLLHPGDEFISSRDVRILLTPISGPWQSLGDAVDYVRELSPKIVVPIHEAVLADPSLYVDYLARLAPGGTTVHRLARREPIDL